MSRQLSREHQAVWEEGAKDMRARASEAVRRTLEERQPLPLNEDRLRIRKRNC